MPSALGEILGAVLLFVGAVWVMRRGRPDDYPGTPRGWFAMYAAYRRDVLARDIYTLPWVESRRDALSRANGMRRDARENLALWTITAELNALGLVDGATQLHAEAMTWNCTSAPIAHSIPSELVSGVADTHPLTADAWRAETTSGAGSLPEARS